MPANLLSPDAPALVFWNTMDSLAEIEASRVGPDAIISGNPGHLSFVESQHGDGFMRNQPYTHVEIPATILDGLEDAGTLELWITANQTQPVGYYNGIYGIVGRPYGYVFGSPRVGGPTNMSISWGDGVTGNGFWGGVDFDTRPGGAATPVPADQYVAEIGQEIHIALAWDTDGIEGSDDTVRLYVDGALSGATDEAIQIADPVWLDPYNLWLGYNAFEKGAHNGSNQFATDNVKIWDGAKTDFSDRFDEDAGAPWTLCTDGDDALTGSAAGDTIEGCGGDDLLRGEGGDDFIFGGAGQDDMFGGTGEDEMFGGAGNDRMFGMADDDMLAGGQGSDFLHGQRGDDVIRGDKGFDKILGAEGTDILEGGLGRDIFFLKEGWGRDVILDYEVARDKLKLYADPADVVVRQTGGDTVVEINANDWFILDGVSLTAFEIDFLFA